MNGLDATESSGVANVSGNYFSPFVEFTRSLLSVIPPEKDLQIISVRAICKFIMARLYLRLLSLGDCRGRCLSIKKMIMRIFLQICLSNFLDKFGEHELCPERMMQILRLQLIVSWSHAFLCTWIHYVCTKYFIKLFTDIFNKYFSQN